MAEKTCSKCGETKPVEEFYKNRSRPDGRGVWCKECTKAYREQNKEHIAAMSRIWYGQNKGRYAAWCEQNRERIAATRKVYYEQNKGRIAAMTKTWYETNKERLLVASRKYSHTHPEMSRKYRHTHPEIYREACNRRRSIKRNVYYEPYDAVVIRERDSYTCYWCGELCGEVPLDHFIPLSAYGHTAAYNLRTIHHRCNSSKGDAIPSVEQVERWAEFLANQPDDDYGLNKFIDMTSELDLFDWE